MEELIESYGLTKKEYRRLIEDNEHKAKDISQILKTPEKVYRFRRFGSKNKDGNWQESPFWEDDVKGICKFSVPSKFNKNDSDDCKVYFDKEVILKKYIPDVLSKYGRITNRKERRAIQSKGKKGLEEYRETLQTTMKVGCFTAVDYTNKDMWYDPYFGDSGRGICIEYTVDRDNFNPDELSFLPVLYDDEHYDNTEAIKAVIDYAESKRNGINNECAASRMVYQGFGHTLIKHTRFEKEHEWRLVIPIREDGAHNHYFNVDRDSKRDMTSAISAIYLGPDFGELAEASKYKAALFAKWNQKNDASSRKVPIYQVKNTGEILTADEISE